jgi:site-specific recombinase XerD
VKEVTFDVTLFQSFYALQPPDRELTHDVLNRKAIVMCALNGVRFVQIAAMHWQTSKRHDGYGETDIKGKDNKIEAKRLFEQELQGTDPVRAFDELHRRASLAQRGREPCGAIFVNSAGTVMTDQQVRNAAATEYKQVGINETKPNMIRSAVVTALHETLTPDADVARLLGHSLQSAVQHNSYQHNDRG